jgi:acyl carrier protein
MKGDDRKADGLVLRQNFPLLDAYVPPRTATERLLAKIWADALGMDEVGVADSYESLGVDSLLAATIFAEMERTFRFPIPMASIIDAPTVELLAVQVDKLAAKHAKSVHA